MNIPGRENISDFWIIGINYKKTEASKRGQFAIDTEKYNLLLEDARRLNIKELFVLSTCNRTEIYGLSACPNVLMDLLCAHTEGTKEDFIQDAYIKQGSRAVEHIFDVAAGLDSQILGDYEILSQLKQFVKQAKAKGFIGTFLERLLNSVLQSSKAIKTNTALSNGTVSVSFAAIQYIQEHVSNVKSKNILLIGTGKIGRSTCKNIIDYLHTYSVTLINRTSSKAMSLAEELGLKYAPVDNLPEEIKKADIIVVASSAFEPVVKIAHLEGLNDKLIIDLSIPYNVEVAAAELPNVQLVNVDLLSEIKDKTLQQRIAEVPKAKAIIAEHIDEFTEWLEKRKHVPMLKALKSKLQQIDKCPFLNSLRFGIQSDDQRIQQVINTTAVKLQLEGNSGCHYIEAINEFIAVK
jgi:glutamyl-tRNA reductase